MASEASYSALHWYPRTAARNSTSRWNAKRRSIPGLNGTSYPISTWFRTDFRDHGFPAGQRPTRVTDWREGRDTDGAGGPLDGDLRWQPELWRRLLARVDQPPPDVRHAETVTRLREGDPGLDLPGRLSLFGHTRLPVTEVELLAALGERRDVHLWLPQPSPALWSALRGHGGVVARDDDDAAAS